MQEFRQAIIAISDICALLAIAALTIVGCLSGYSFGSVASYAASDAFVRLFILLFFIGLFGTAGFVLAALPAALLMTLSDIAANTRKSLERLDHLVGSAPKISDEKEHKRSDRKEQKRSALFLKDGDSLTQASVDVLKRAKEAGFTITMDNGTITISRDGSPTQTFSSNGDIIYFSETLRQLGYWPA